MRIRAGMTFQVVGTGFAAMDRVYSGASPATELLGGSCGNVLVSLAMLRRAVAPVLRLGLDDTGRRLTEWFRAAGADTRFIRRDRWGRSPIVVQRVDPELGLHTFAFRCVETDEELPRYVPIGREDYDEAKHSIETCSVFYTDRLSDVIVDAMEAAAKAGAMVFFEPSAIGDRSLFARAVGATTILKFSFDRIARLPVGALPRSPRSFTITTHGRDGLELRADGLGRWMAAVPAPRVRDTCGAGDMLSVGIIDRLLGGGVGAVEFEDVVAGVDAGQRLAAANCAFVGARGVFVAKGSRYVRSLLGEN